MGLPREELIRLFAEFNAGVARARLEYRQHPFEYLTETSGHRYPCAREGCEEGRLWAARHADYMREVMRRRRAEQRKSA